MSLKSQTRDPQLKSLPEYLCSGFLRPEKIHRPQSGLNPRTLNLEASTLPKFGERNRSEKVAVHWAAMTIPSIQYNTIQYVHLKIKK